MGNKEALEVINSSDKRYELTYHIPKLHRRVLANLIDIIIFFLVGLAIFIAVNAVAVNTANYKKADEVVATYRKECGLYKYSSERKTYELVTTWLENNNDTEYPTRVQYCVDAIESFQNYVKNKSTIENYNILIKDYRDSRLSDKLTYQGVKYFTVDASNNVINNPACSAKAENYYKDFYQTYIVQNCSGYLISFFPDYYNSTKYMSNVLFFVELPITLTLASALVYLLPPLLIRRGRKTLGKWLYHMGLVDKNVTSPSLGRFLIRYAIFFFVEVLASLFTFGVPIFVSFSLMIFSKKKQGFPDYILGITEVDESMTKIYFTKYEALVDQIQEGKTPVNFKPVQKE